MKEYIFDKVDESIYKETLNNGVDVYLYPFPKTKNFYCTITVNYGSKYTKYKKGKKIYDIIPGSAHFLEHRIMITGEDPDISKRIDDLGSLANAWTGYHATNYNIFGSENIIENIRILLDMFYKPKFVKKDIDEEKGIISEEIDMGKDQIGRLLSVQILKNAFNRLHCINTAIGEKEDIEKITPKSLKQIYDDFYIPSNTFIVIAGNFNKEEVMNEIKNYYGKLKLKNKKVPKRIIEKEPENVRIDYEEVKKDMEDVRVKILIKMKKNLFDIKDDSILQSYLNSVLGHNFSTTSKLYEKYKNEDIIFSMGVRADIIDNYVAIVISAVTNRADAYIENIKKDIKKLTLNKDDFERTKKRYIKDYIMSFENIEDVEYNIADSLTSEGRICYDEYDFFSNMSYETALNVMKRIDTTYISIIRTVK